MTDIIDRLTAYAETNDMLGAYTEANCAYDAIDEIKKLREQKAKLIEELKDEIKSRYPEYALRYPHKNRKYESEMKALEEYYK